jgi:signal transduction histidine kinase
MGISKTDQNKLFTKFFRAEDARKKHIGGTGLGLSIVKSIVEMHGGSITVDSTLNRGSTFTVILPTGE